LTVRLRTLLKSPDFEDTLRDFEFRPKTAISPLLSFLYETDDLVRGRAVRAIGETVSKMAESSPESARNIMRRLIWSLNDESGGIGWGAPEAMGEIMAQNEMLAGEYYRILISYIDEDGNPLENGPLERGVLWGIGRLARSRPELTREAIGPVLKQLTSADPAKRGLAVWALLAMKPDPELAVPLVRSLLGDEYELSIYEDGKIWTFRVREMVSELLAMMDAG
jgi:HEAT repeat protein